MIAKVEIEAAMLIDICEKACETHKQALMELDNLYDIKSVVGCLVDVVRLWKALYDNFDVDDELVLTIEKREGRDGTDERR